MENIYQMGFIIKEYRKKLGFTQKELAQKIGVSDKAVSKWERCESLPDVTLVPQIAQVLEISIEYLMTGSERVKETYNPSDEADIPQKTSAECATEENFAEKAQTLSNAARIMHSKINTEYTVCTCILFMVLITGLVETVLYGFLWWDFQDIICAVVSVAVFAVFHMHIHTKTVMLEGMNVRYTGGAGAVSAFMAASNVLILVFMGIQTKGSVSLIDFVLGTNVIALNDSRILYGGTGYGWMLLLLLLFAVVTANMLISKKSNYFTRNTVAVFAAGAVMSVAHRLFFAFIEEYIVSEEQYLYTFYLDKPNAVRVIGNIERYTLVYFIAVAIFGVAAALIFSKGLSRKLCAAGVMLAFAVYLGVSAQNFLGFEAYGRYYAQLFMHGVKGSVVITAMLPHIVMMFNRIAGEHKPIKM